LFHAEIEPAGLLWESAEKLETISKYTFEQILRISNWKRNILTTMVIGNISCVVFYTSSLRMRW
jgi:hypothetical protein